MNYIEIDFNKVNGFKKLTPEQQELFKNTYKRHNSCHGSDYKDEWIPVSVKWIVDNVDNYYSFLKVVFKNGEWLHYTKRQEWY